jgi:branched-chain amino acid transport system ATP-binding protein
MGNDVVLDVRDLKVSYGRIAAVKGVSFQVRQGEMVSLIGANGAGKTTILKAISRLIDYSGDVFYNGTNLRGVAAHDVSALGIAHVPEGRGLFGNLTVGENLALATWGRRDRLQIKNDYARIFSSFPILEKRRNQFAGTLSGGEQQMLALARAMISRPGIFILDEPSMGLSPLIVRQIFNMLAEINRQGTAVLLVEQNANMALKLASRAYVLETGLIVLTGSGRDLLKNARVKESYLGA